jgi:hypothetical protein
MTSNHPQRSIFIEGTLKTVLPGTFIYLMEISQSNFCYVSIGLARTELRLLSVGVAQAETNN